MFTSATSSPSGATAAHDRVPWRTPDRLWIYTLIAAASFVAYIIAKLAEGPVATAFAVFGVSACGWSWLLTRAIFDPARRDVFWPRAVVFVLLVSGAVSVLTPDGGVISRVAANLYVLSGSAAMVLTLSEPFQAHRCEITPRERVFRIVFLAVFTALVAVSTLGLWVEPAPVQTASAVVGLAGAIAAVLFRRHHPLVVAARPSPARPQATDEDVRLAAQVTSLLSDEAIHAEPNLKVADVAVRLGEPEYKISRCISACLGFPNFNRLINHHRIEQAKAMLADADQRRSILEIAFECGFASLGPFNRAFKVETGLTPRAFRRNATGALPIRSASPAAPRNPPFPGPTPL